jgi:hypothetical protein
MELDRLAKINLSKTLVDEVSALEYITQMCSEVHKDDPDKGEKLSGEMLSKIIAEGNNKIVYKYAESPIEKIFLSSLNISSILHGSCIFRFDAPHKDTNTAVRTFRKNAKWFFDMRKVFISATKERGLDSFLIYCEYAGYIPKEEIEEAKWTLIFEQEMGFSIGFHVIPQAEFPDVIIDGRSIRADIFIFSPLNKKCNVIIECDGYEYHKEKESFIRDRKRDRILHNLGFQILRYSGTEIYTDPINTCGDIFNYLHKHYPHRDKGYQIIYDEKDGK